jgi:cell division septum initiation protein DivIVA
MNDKDVLIKQLEQRNESLLEKIQQLSAEILELKEHIARLEKNSATSSKPPSSYIIHQQPTSVVRKKNASEADMRDIPNTFVSRFPPMRLMRPSSISYQMMK